MVSLLHQIGFTSFPSVCPSLQSSLRAQEMNWHSVRLSQQDKTINSPVSLLNGSQLNLTYLQASLQLVQHFVIHCFYAQESFYLVLCLKSVPQFIPIITNSELKTKSPIYPSLWIPLFLVFCLRILGDFHMQSQHVDKLTMAEGH